MSEEFEGKPNASETMRKYGFVITVAEVPGMNIWEWSVIPENFGARPASAAGKAKTREDATMLAMVVLEKARTIRGRERGSTDPEIEMTYAEANAIPSVEIVPAELPEKGVRVYRCGDDGAISCYLIRSTTDGGREMLKVRVVPDEKSEA